MQLWTRDFMRYSNLNKLFLSIVIAIIGAYCITVVASDYHSRVFSMPKSNSIGQGLLLMYRQDRSAFKSNIKTALAVTDAVAQNEAFNIAEDMNTTFKNYVDADQQLCKARANSYKYYAAMLISSFTPLLIGGAYYGWKYYSITRKIADGKNRAKQNLRERNSRKYCQSDLHCAVMTIDHSLNTISKKRLGIRMRTSEISNVIMGFIPEVKDRMAQNLSRSQDEYKKELQDIDEQGSKDKNSFKSIFYPLLAITYTIPFSIGLLFGVLSAYYAGQYHSLYDRHQALESRFADLHNEFSVLVGPRR